MVFADENLGRPIEVPMIYSTALPWLDRYSLRRARVLVVDDTVLTGNSLARHREQILRYGAKDISAVTCIAYGDPNPAAECFQLVEDHDLYREYVWQLAELVVARGLPPEIDHHVLTLQLPERLPVAWEMLQGALAKYGTVTIDQACDPDECLSSLTLHFPRLPCRLEHPTEGVAYPEGVSKLRFFPDPVTEDIHVIPMSFPALDVPSVDCANGGQELARDFLRTWTQGDGGIGELLVDCAKSCDPEMVFRALSTVSEVDLLCGLARVLRETFTIGDSTMVCQRDVVDRLYGEPTGELVADHIDAQIAGVLNDVFWCEDDSSVPVDEPRSPEFVALDGEVVDTTIRIAKYLQGRYEQDALQSDHDPTRTIGESLSELTENLDLDRLLVSRCLDFGVGMTTLVPYVQVDPFPEGGTRVRRGYRVSELDRDPTHEDLEDVYQWISEETVAFIAHHLSTRSELYPAGGIPVRTLVWVAAILRPLLLRAQRVALGSMPVGQASTVVLRGGVRRLTLADVEAGNLVSVMFTVGEDGVRPTPRFEDLTKEDRLRIDLREESVEIEDYLSLIVKVMETKTLDAETLDQVLAAWAMCTDEKLGLSYVGGDLEQALWHLENPLKQILSGEPHEASAMARTSAEGMAEAALKKLDSLQLDWRNKVGQGLENPTKRARSVHNSLAGPEDRTALYLLPLALVEMMRGFAKLVSDLDSASAKLWAGTSHGTDAHDVAVNVLSDCSVMRRALTSMRDDRESVVTPEVGREAIVQAAEHMLYTLGMLRAFAAACAGSYRGVRGARVAHKREAQRMAAILFVDISGSLEYALRHDFAENHEWKNSGLNLIAQWGRALGGREMKDREGDAIWLEFERPGDAVVLCAAALQVHASALRSTKVPWLWWAFRLGLDEGQLEDGDGGNVIGPCLDVAAKLAKDHKEVNPVDKGLATPKCQQRCTPPLRNDSCMPPLGTEIVLSEIEGAPATRTMAHVLEPRAIMQEFSKRVKRVGTALAEGRPGVDALVSEQMLIEPDSGSGASDEENESSG